MNKPIIVTVTAACLVAALAGCSAGDEPTGITDYAPAPSTSRSSAAPPTTETSATTPAPVADGGPCLDPTSPGVLDAVRGIDSFYGHDFVVGAHTDAPPDACPALRWVQADLAGGTGSSPTRIAFFDADGFLRYDADHNTAFTRVTASTNRSVTVAYRWLEPGDATADPTGGPVSVTYTLTGRTVVADRPVPDEAFADAPTAPDACTSADPATLRDAAAASFGDDILAPFTVEDITCDGRWALGRTATTAVVENYQPARVLFRHVDGAWTAVAFGSGFSCTEHGTPQPVAVRLGCS